MHAPAKRTSWLELFYDLVFVAIIAQFTYVVANLDWNIETFFLVILVGYMIFTAWWGTTVSRNLQEEETTTDRLLVQAQMLIAFLLSLYLPDVFDEGSLTRFFGAYAALRTLQLFLIARVYWLHPKHRPQTYNMVQAFAISIVLWLIAAFLPLSEFVYVIAAMALVIEVLAPLTRGKGNTTRLLNVSHMQERLGLFLLLVMGESMLVVALANTAVSTGLVQPFVIIAGVLYLIGLWWLYFSHLEHEAEGTRPQSLFWYLQSHAILFGSVVIIAAAYTNVLKHGAFVYADATLLIIGSVLIMLMLLLIRTALFGVRMIRIAIVGLMVLSFLAVGALAITLESIVVLVGGTTACMLVFAWWDERRRKRQLAVSKV